MALYMVFGVGASTDRLEEELGGDLARHAGSGQHHGGEEVTGDLAVVELGGAGGCV